MRTIPNEGIFAEARVTRRYNIYIYIYRHRLFATISFRYRFARLVAFARPTTAVHRLRPFHYSISSREDDKRDVASAPRRRVSDVLVDLYSLMGSRNAVETGKASGREEGVVA